jgi:type IV pilus assembly protein PilX
MNDKTTTLNQKQNGSALMISLFIMVAMTVVGLTALKDTLMDEKMAANIQNNTIAFQNAEVAINETFEKITKTETIINQVADPNTGVASTWTNSGEKPPACEYADYSCDATVNYDGDRLAFGSTANIKTGLVGRKLSIVGDGGIENISAKATTRLAAQKAPYLQLPNP